MVFYALLRDAGDLSTLFKSLPGKAGNSYLAVTARRIETGELSSGQSVLNIKVIGSGDYPESYGIWFERVSTEKGRERIFAKFFPEDILSIEIVRDETP